MSAPADLDVLRSRRRELLAELAEMRRYADPEDMDDAADLAEVMAEVRAIEAEINEAQA